MNKIHNFGEKLEKSRYLPICWILLSIAVLIGDFFAGPYVQFPILFLVPVSLASWYSGRRWGFVLAAAMPVIRFSYVILWNNESVFFELAVNNIIRIMVLSLFAFFLDRTSLERKALSKQIRMLEGLLTVCSCCKRIQNEKEQWEPMEKYISEHSEADFSHGLCPECLEKYYGKYFNDNQKYSPIIKTPVKLRLNRNSRRIVPK